MVDRLCVSVIETREKLCMYDRTIPVRGIALEWFRNYLKNRSQFVSYLDIHSANCSVTCGVPQGSVLGPLLFIIYTNDLPHSLTHSNCILFADDTTIYCTSNDKTTLQRNIENDMTSLADCQQTVIKYKKNCWYFLPKIGTMS